MKIRQVKVKLPYIDLDALRVFVDYHSDRTNILLREWIDDHGSKKKEEIKYVFEEE